MALIKITNVWFAINCVKLSLRTKYVSYNLHNTILLIQLCCSRFTRFKIKFCSNSINLLNYHKKSKNVIRNLHNIFIKINTYFTNSNDTDLPPNRLRRSYFAANIRIESWQKF